MNRDPYADLKARLAAAGFEKPLSNRERSFVIYNGEGHLERMVEVVGWLEDNDIAIRFRRATPWSEPPPPRHVFIARADHGTVFRFADANDALLFKMRWSDLIAY